MPKIDVSICTTATVRVTGYGAPLEMTIDEAKELRQRIDDALRAHYAPCANDVRRPAVGDSWRVSDGEPPEHVVILGDGGHLFPLLTRRGENWAWLPRDRDDDGDLGMPWDEVAHLAEKQTFTVVQVAE